MPVKHIREVSIDKPADCDYLNADHKLLDMLGYELIERQIIPADSNICFFSDLDLNSDFEYVLKLFVTLVPATNNSYLKLLVNDNSDLAVEGVEHIAISDNAGHNYTAMTYLCCGRTTNVQSTLLLGECKLVKQNSTYTVFKSDADSFSDTHATFQHHNGVVRSTDNVSSISIAPTTGTFSGVIELYKKIPLTPE